MGDRPQLLCWVLLVLCAAASGQCPGGWLPVFGGTQPNDVVFASVVFDDGTGPHLYASGQFGGFVPDTSVIAKWTGSAWTLLATSAKARAFAVWNDGTGSALYAAGDWPIGATHAYAVRRLVGSSWVQVGSSLPALPTSMTVFDPDGPGPLTPALFIGGSTVRMLSGSAWVTIGSTTSGDSLCVYDADGAGPGLPVLAAGGFPAVAGGASVAAWNGAVWMSLGGGFLANNPFSGGVVAGTVAALAVYDLGSGPMLYAGGTFFGASGVATQNLAAWNGASWGSVGNVVGTTILSAPVTALGVFDDGTGSKLCVGGAFTSAGGVPAANVARFGPAGWSALGSGVSTSTFNFGWQGPQVFGLASVDPDGAGSTPAVLVVTGAFQVAGGMGADGVASWNGTTWSPIGIPTSVLGRVHCTEVFDDGTGPALYVGGSFTVAGGVVANSIAKFDGNTWTALGPGMNSPVFALAGHDDGTGPKLYAGGQFTSGPGQPGNGLASWNGTSWSAVGGGFTGGNQTAVCALAVHDDGTGPKLYAGGQFTTAGGVAANHIARWNGITWTPLGSGVLAPYPIPDTYPPGWVRTLTSFDPDGNGPLAPVLCAGGRFDTIGGIAAQNVAAWNGTAWSNLSTGLSSFPLQPMNGTVHALRMSGVEGPPRLFAAGAFTLSGSTTVGGTARWDGSSWSSVGGDLSPAPFSFAAGFALATWNDGGGENLYLGGRFGAAGGVPAIAVARWNGTTWSSLGAGIGEPLSTVWSFAIAPCSALVIGGEFNTVGGIPSFSLGVWMSGAPAIAITQPGGADTGAVVVNTNLNVSTEYYNIFSTQPCGTVGSGPYLGLCATNVLTLLNQYLLPVGSLPFHFSAPGPMASFGPYPLPPGLVVDGIVFTQSAGGLCASPVSRLVVQ